MGFENLNLWFLSNVVYFRPLFLQIFFSVPIFPLLIFKWNKCYMYTYRFLLYSFIYFFSHSCSVWMVSIDPHCFNSYLSLPFLYWTHPVIFFSDTEFFFALHSSFGSFYKFYFLFEKLYFCYFTSIHPSFTEHGFGSCFEFEVFVNFCLV